MNERIYCRLIFIVRCFLLLSSNPRCKSATHLNPKVCTNQTVSIVFSISTPSTNLFVYLKYFCIVSSFFTKCAHPTSSFSSFHKSESGAANHSKTNRKNLFELKQINHQSALLHKSCFSPPNCQSSR